MNEKKVTKISGTLLKISQLKNCLTKQKKKKKKSLPRLEQSARVEVIYKYLLNH